MQKNPRVEKKIKTENGAVLMPLLAFDSFLLVLSPESRQISVYKLDFELIYKFFIGLI